MERSLGVDGNGIEEFFVDDGQRFLIKDVHKASDINKILEQNKREQNDNSKNQTRDKSLRKVASIPIALWVLWKKLYGVDPLKRENKSLLQRLLNDPDLRELRTDRGHVVFKDH